MIIYILTNTHLAIYLVKKLLNILIYYFDSKGCLKRKLEEFLKLIIERLD